MLFFLFMGIELFLEGERKSKRVTKKEAAVISAEKKDNN